MTNNKLIAEFMGFPQQSDVVDDRTTAYYIGDVIKATNENNQNEDGSVNIPNVLKKYMNNLDKI